MFKFSVLSYQERESIIDESEKLTSLLTASKEDIKNVSELLERTDKEKRRLQEKNAKLTITGKVTFDSLCRIWKELRSNYKLNSDGKFQRP